MTISDKYNRLREAIEETRALIKADNTEAENAGRRLCEVFEADMDISGCKDYTPEKAYLQIQTLETILQLHIKRGDPVDISIRYGQLVKKLKEDLEHFPDWEDEDKRLIGEIGLQATRLVHDFYAIEYQNRAEKFAKSRTPECKCLLCRKSFAIKTGSHMVPHLLIADVFSYDGSRQREKVVVASASLSEGRTERYFGNKVYEDTINELLGRGFTDEEVEREIKKRNLLTLDYVFCKDCEDRFAVIESYYSDIISGRIKKYPPEIPYLFWMSVIWRMSVGDMGLPMEKDHLEKLRKNLGKCLALKRDAIKCSKSQLGHCAYILHKAKDTKDETLGIIGPHVVTDPYRAMIGGYLVEYFPTIQAAKKYCKRSGIAEGCINTGATPEQIVEMEFIGFWLHKRELLDLSWENDRSVWNLGNKSDNTLWKFEKDEIRQGNESEEEGNHDGMISPWINPENANVIVLPRSIRKILKFIEENHATSNDVDSESGMKEMEASIGYTREEIGVMMDYYRKFLEKQELKQKEEEITTSNLLHFLDYFN